MEKSQQYEQVFNHFDEDGSGRISEAEMQMCVGTIEGELSEEEAVRLEDIVRLMEGEGGAAEEEEEEEEDLREAFKMYEMEGRGYITPASLRRMLRKFGESKITVEQCEFIISQYDLNGDGVLNFHEFKVMMSYIN